MENKKERRRLYNAQYRKNKENDEAFWEKQRAAGRASYSKRREYYITRSNEWKEKNRKKAHGYRKSIRAKLSWTKCNARTRNLSWNLTDEEAIERFMLPCLYCGKEATENAWNGIDRMDNDKGYEVGNSASACFRCNKAKGIMSLKELFEMCRDVVAYQTK
jgi:hypothetical protein